MVIKSSTTISGVRVLRCGCQHYIVSGDPGTHKHIRCIVFGGDGDIKVDRVTNACESRCSGSEVDFYIRARGKKVNGVLYSIPLGVKLRVGVNGGGSEVIRRRARSIRAPAAEDVAIALGLDGGLGGLVAAHDGLRRGHIVHARRVLMERHGVGRRGRGGRSNSYGDRYHTAFEAGNVGVEKSGLNLVDGTFRGKARRCVTRTVRPCGNLDSLSFRTVFEENGVAGVGGIDSDVKRLALHRRDRSDRSGRVCDLTDIEGLGDRGLLGSAIDVRQGYLIFAGLVKLEGDRRYMKGLGRQRRI